MKGIQAPWGPGKWCDCGKPHEAGGPCWECRRYRLTANPPPEWHKIGLEHGETCGRYPEPDEDQPREYRPKPCKGVMDFDERYGMICCDTCGEIA